MEWSFFVFVDQEGRIVGPVGHEWEGDRWAIYLMPYVNDAQLEEIAKELFANLPDDGLGVTWLSVEASSLEEAARMVKDAFPGDGIEEAIFPDVLDLD
jgi:hypothetical protein